MSRSTSDRLSLIPFMGDAFNLRSAALRLADEENDPDTGKSQVLSMRGCPKYIKVMYADFRRAAQKDGVYIQAGHGWAAALNFGLIRLVDHPQIGLWIKAVDDATGPDMPLSTRVRLQRLIETPDYSIPDPVGAGMDTLSFRVPQKIHARLYETQSILSLEKRTAMLALPAIAAGLAYQPGVQDEASEHMESAFAELIDTFDSATRDLRSMRTA